MNTRDETDRAVLAHRACPCEMHHDAILVAMRAHNDRFMRSQTIEYITRTKG